jgi:hypothetical protein
MTPNWAVEAPRAVSERSQARGGARPALEGPNIDYARPASEGPNIYSARPVPEGPIIIPLDLFGRLG